MSKRTVVPNGPEIARRRVARGWSQQRFVTASAAVPYHRVSIASIQRAERGLWVYRRTIESIAVVLQCDAASLLAPDGPGPGVGGALTSIVLVASPVSSALARHTEVASVSLVVTGAIVAFALTRSPDATTVERGVGAAAGAFKECFGGTVAQPEAAGAFTLTRTQRGVDAGCFFYLSAANERFPLSARGATRLDVTPGPRINGAFYGIALQFWNGNDFVGESDWMKDEIRTVPLTLRDVEGWARSHDCARPDGTHRHCWPATALVLQVRVQPVDYDPASGRPGFTFSDIRVRPPR